MRLLYLNHNVSGRGTYQRAFNFARAMVARGHEVTLVTTSPVNRLAVWEGDRDGVRVVEAPDLWWGPARTGWDPWNTLRRMVALRGEAPDLIHAFDGRPVVSLPGVWLSRRRNAPLVMDWADWWGRGGLIQERSGWPVRTFFGPVETWFEEAFRPRATAHTVISRALEARCRSLGLDGRPILRLSNGCDPVGVVPLSRDECRSALGIPLDVPLLVHLGTLTRGDMDYLARALDAALAREPRLRLALVGSPGAPVPGSVRRTGALLTPGFVDAATMNRWLGAADACLLVLPDTVGHRGRWPGKVNDYCSAGRATVTTDVGDVAALVRERRLGWVTAPDPGAFAAGMVEALAHPDEAVAAGHRARQLSTQELAWPFLAERLERLYESVLSPPGPASG